MTAAGIADGFTLTEFASGFPGGSIGPLGMAVNSANGTVLVDSNGDSQNYIFHDVDGQTLGTAISHTANAGFPPAYAYTNGSFWGSGGFSGSNVGNLIKFNNDGTIAQMFSGSPITNGLWTNPVNGHMLGAGSSGIYDIDVSGATPVYHKVTSTSSDGVTVSPDGTLVCNTSVSCFNITTGTMTFGPHGVGGADGMGIITGGKFNGDIIVNSNFGDVDLLDPTTGTDTIIANGGSRGDYTTDDATNGTLLLTQSDSIWRLAVAGGGIGNPGGGGTPAPEPASLALLGAGLAGLGWVRRRKH